VTQIENGNWLSSRSWYRQHQVLEEWCCIAQTFYGLREMVLRENGHAISGKGDKAAKARSGTHNILSNYMI